MNQAIVTKYLGPTNHRGTRIKAIAAGGRVTVPYDSALSVDENERFAAIQLVMRLKWPRDGWVAGRLPDGRTAWIRVQS